VLCKEPLPLPLSEGLRDMPCPVVPSRSSNKLPEDIVMAAKGQFAKIIQMVDIGQDRAELASMVLL
jgi:hypothetical protein